MRRNIEGRRVLTRGKGSRILKISWLLLASAASIATSRAATAAPEDVSEVLRAKSRQESPNRRTAALPTGTFHVVLQTESDDRTDEPRITLHFLVSPSTRHLAGAFQMAQPMQFQAVFNGQYVQASSSAVNEATLSGYPQLGSPCIPSRIVVDPNVKIELRIEPDWREGTATISYPPDPKAFRHQGEWRNTSAIKLTGGRPIGWRGVSGFRLTSGEPIPRNDECFESDNAANRRLRRLGRDASGRRLDLSSSLEGSLRQWYLRNRSSKHILARYACYSTAPGRRYTDTQTTLVHPYEDQALDGFPDVQRRVCRVEQSHYD